MSIPFDYVRDGNAIYERSFAIIREEAELGRFSPEEADVAVRMIHACGLVEAAFAIDFAPDLVRAARAALDAGAPILCDAEMVAHGVTRARLPAGNEVICTLREPAVPGLAERLGTTRSAAALELWRDKMEGAVIAIGNAPTALFRLLECSTPARPGPPPFSAFPSASSARPNPRTRWPPATTACRGWWCAVGWGAAP